MWEHLIALIPQLLWFVFAVVVFCQLYPLITKLIEDGSISKLSIGVVQVELTKLTRSADADLVEDAKRDLISDSERGEITARFAQMAKKIKGATVLWVDDNHPQQNVRERRVLLAAGMSVDLANSTTEAIKWLDRSKYDVVITNGDRSGDPTNNPTAKCSADSTLMNAGCYLLAKIHQLPQNIRPLGAIMYVGSYQPEHGTPAYATGITNRPAELFGLVLDAIERKVLKH